MDLTRRDFLRCISSPAIQKTLQYTKYKILWTSITFEIPLWNFVEAWIRFEVCFQPQIKNEYAYYFILSYCKQNWPALPRISEKKIHVKKIKASLTEWLSLCILYLYCLKVCWFEHEHQYIRSVKKTLHNTIFIGLSIINSISV